MDLVINKNYYIKCITISDRLNAIAYCEDVWYRMDDKDFGKCQTKIKWFNYLMLSKWIMWFMSDKDALRYITTKWYECVSVPSKYIVNMEIWRQLLFELAPYLKLELFWDNSKIESILRKYLPN